MTPAHKAILRDFCTQWLLEFGTGEVKNAALYDGGFYSRHEVSWRDEDVEGVLVLMHDPTGHRKDRTVQLTQAALDLIRGE